MVLRRTEAGRAVPPAIPGARDESRKQKIESRKLKTKTESGNLENRNESVKKLKVEIQKAEIYFCSLLSTFKHLT
jgi:hypothetical protein